MLSELLLPLPRQVRTHEWMLRLAEAIEHWRERSVGRARLGQLDERLLKDIGLSRADAWWEAGKPFWRA